MKYLYDDDDDEEEFPDFFDDPYPEEIIGLNEDKFMEIYEQVKSGKRRTL